MIGQHLRDTLAAEFQETEEPLALSRLSARRKNHGQQTFDSIRGVEMNPDELRSPRISYLTWGCMEVDGVGEGKDFKLWPGGGREWDWRDTNTHHEPGIQPVDVGELLDNGSRAIVLSRGMLMMLRTCPETLDLLEKKHIEVYFAETKAAVEIYNGLAARGEAVGGLFHSTC